jgi:hypothetical protein
MTSNSLISAELITVIIILNHCKEIKLIVASWAAFLVIKLSHAQGWLSDQCSTQVVPHLFNIIMPPITVRAPLSLSWLQV